MANDSSDLYAADDMERKKVEYVWHDRIPFGQIGIMAGRPGGGKSTIASDIAAHVTRDLKHGVLCSNQEDAESPVRARLQAAGADLSRVLIPSDGYKFPDDIGLLTMHIVAHGIRLAVFDTAAQHLGCNMNNDQDVRRALSPLKKVAEMTNCAMLFVTHVTKHVSKNAYPLSAIGGSGGIAGAARYAFFVGPNPENINERCAVWVKDQYRAMPLGLSFEVEGYNILDEDDKITATTQRAILTADGVDLEPMALLQGKAKDDDGSGPTSDKRAGAAEWLTIYLSVGKQGATQVRDAAALAGISYATLKRSADDVGIEKYREGFGPGSKLYWQLPDGHPALISDDEVNEIEAVEPDATTGRTDFLAPGFLDPPAITEDDEVTLTDEDMAQLLSGS